MRGWVRRRPRARWVFLGLGLAACGGKANRAGGDGTSAPSAGGSAVTSDASSGGATSSGSGGSGGVGANGTSASEVVSVAAGGSSSGGSGVGGGAGQRSYLPWDEVCPELIPIVAGSGSECGSIEVYYEPGDPSSPCTIEVGSTFEGAEPVVAVDCDLVEEVPLGQAGASSRGWYWDDTGETDQIVLEGEACERIRSGVHRVDVVLVCPIRI